MKKLLQEKPTQKQNKQTYITQNHNNRQTKTTTKSNKANNKHTDTQRITPRQNKVKDKQNIEKQKTQTTNT